MQKVPYIFITLLLLFTVGCNSTSRHFTRDSSFNLSEFEGKTITIFADYLAYQNNKEKTDIEVLLDPSKQLAKEALNHLHQSLESKGFIVKLAEHSVGYATGNSRIYLLDNQKDKTPQITNTPLFFSNNDLANNVFKFALNQVMINLVLMDNAALKKEAELLKQNTFSSTSLKPRFDLYLPVKKISANSPSDYYLFFSGYGIEARRGAKAGSVTKTIATGIATGVLTAGLFAYIPAQPVYYHFGKILLVDSVGNIKWLSYYSMLGNRSKMLKKNIDKTFKLDFK